MAKPKNNWWDTLSYDEQTLYLKEHPGSKRKVSKRKGGRKTNSEDHEKRATVIEPEVEIPEMVFPPFDVPKKPSVLKKVTAYVKENKLAIAAVVVPLLLSGRNKLDKGIDGNSTQENSSIAKALRTAITLKDHPALDKISKYFGWKSGLVLVGLTGLALFAGVDLTIAIPLLIDMPWWDSLSSTKADDDAEYLKKASSAYYEKIKQELLDEEKLAAAIVVPPTDTPVVPIQTVDETKTDTDTSDNDNEAPISKTPKQEAAAFTSASNHESDLNKALVRVEKLNVSARTEEAIRSKPLQRVKTLVEHAYLLESSIPKIANILIASVPQKLSLSNRAKVQLSLFSRELDKCRTEIANLAAKTPLKKTPLAQLLKKNVQFSAYAYETAYVQSEDGVIHHCEVHKFTTTETATATVYAYYEKNKLHVANVFNSNFYPRSFDQIAARNVTGWLQETGLAG